MTRLSLPLLALVLTLAPAAARADIAWYPPSPPAERTPVGATLRGQPYTAFRAVDADHVLFTARNPTAVAVTLTLVTLTEGGHAVSLANVQANGHAVSGGAITVAPGSTVRVVIHVTPSRTEAAPRRTFSLRATLAGRNVTATTTLTLTRPMPQPMPTS